MSRGRDYVIEGSLGESLRSGSRLLQPSLPGGKGVRRLETSDRPLSFQRVRKGDFLASIDLKGVCLLRYLDDWPVLASTEARARQHVRDLLSLCNSLGVVLNREKSDLNPSQSVEYLGMTIDTVAARAYRTLPRIDKFIATARKFLARRDPPAQLWQVLLGHMSSLEKLVPRGRLRMHSLQWHLKSHWSPERDPPDLPVPRSRQVEEDLSWWMVRDHLL